MLLWVDKGESKEGKVSAVVPRSTDDLNLRDMVLKYQIHNCRPGRCFKKDAKYKFCKYGFPYALQKQDNLDDLDGLAFDTTMPGLRMKMPK